MPKTYEYNEGKSAQENFEKSMEALFQVPEQLQEDGTFSNLLKRGNFPSAPEIPGCPPFPCFIEW
jgi:hypothetical protein